VRSSEAISGDPNNLARARQLSLWPTFFALKELTPAEKAKIGALVKKAMS
jgi:hypothetical protein